MGKKITEMVSKHCFDEIREKVRNVVGANAFPMIFPAVCKALVIGSAACREEVINDWLEIDSCRVCSNCGEIIEEGWYLGDHGYACSEDCCKKLMDVSDEEYDRYGIYYKEVAVYLSEEGLGRRPEDLSEKELHDIIVDIVDGLDEYYYTVWS